MIRLTRRHRGSFVVNLASIQYVESTPDTMVVFTNGERVLVEESVDDVVARAIAYQRAIFADGVVVDRAGSRE
ncbi:flagellar FlbD family protein [Myxococcota bacterium]|nr:flagellar FlbD family protein [Myxococcota bacterium]